MIAPRQGEELNGPYVGIVKTVEKDKGYGFIMIEYHKDIYFKLKECHIKDVTPFTYVAFKKRISSRTNRVEAYEIRHVSDYKNELLLIQDKLLVSERDLIYYCCKDLCDKKMEQLTDFETKALSNIDSYLENLNVEDVIDSYNVTVREGHIYKPGDDDTAMVDYVGSRLKGNYLFQDRSSFRTKSVRDVYLDKLLPEFSERIFYERAFCPWEDLLAGFGDLSEYRKKAEERTKIARQRARQLYDKEEHKKSLEKMLNRNIASVINDYQMNLEESLQGSLDYGFDLNIKLENMKY